MNLRRILQCLCCHSETNEDNKLPKPLNIKDPTNTVVPVFITSVRSRPMEESPRANDAKAVNSNQPIVTTVVEEQVADMPRVTP